MAMFKAMTPQSWSREPEILTFVLNVRSRLVQLGMTQAQLAAALNMHPVSVSRKLTGQHLISLSDAVNFAKATKCDLAKLLEPIQQTAARP
jgi:transcriptional regulator with XRE-family HTH domain